MPEYVVTHHWHDFNGEPYLRIVPGVIPHIDIAFYVADLITAVISLPSAVYLRDPEHVEIMQLQDRPAELTMDPADFPALRVLPGSSEGEPPDLVTAPNAGGGGGIGLRTTLQNQPEGSNTLTQQTTTPITPNETTS